MGDGYGYAKMAAVHKKYRIQLEHDWSCSEPQQHNIYRVDGIFPTEERLAAYRVGYRGEITYNQSQYDLAEMIEYFMSTR